MDRSEKLRLSADAEWCPCYKHGMFARFFEQGLWWFSHSVKPLKPMLERVKGGEPLIYGGLPVSGFEKLVEGGALQGVETTEYGWRWPYAGQKTLPEDVPPYGAWRTEALASTQAMEKTDNGDNGGNGALLTEIAAFNLAAHTPMQAMNANLQEKWEF